MAFEYLNQQSSQSPIHHCSLIQSGPVSQSEQGLASAPGQQPRHWQRVGLRMKRGRGREGRGKKSKKKRQHNEQTNVWRHGDGRDWGDKRGQSGKKSQCCSCHSCRSSVTVYTWADCVVRFSDQTTDQPLFFFFFLFFLFAALPRRTWAAGEETSAGNTMVRWSWWVLIPRCRPLCVVASHLRAWKGKGGRRRCWHVGGGGGADESWHTGCGPIICCGRRRPQRAAAGFICQSNFFLLLLFCVVFFTSFFSSLASWLPVCRIIVRLLCILPSPSAASPSAPVSVPRDRLRATGSAAAALPV